jgi:hypothetical protein
MNYYPNKYSSSTLCHVHFPLNDIITSVLQFKTFKILRKLHLKNWSFLGK